MEIEVWDKDRFTKDDLIGSGSYALSSIFNRKSCTEWITLKHNGEAAGQICLNMEWISDSMKVPQYHDIKENV